MQSPDAPNRGEKSGPNENALIKGTTMRFSLITAVLAVFATASVEAKTVLITGANSGIGLEFAKQYAGKGWDVIATHRRSTEPDPCHFA